MISAILVAAGKGTRMGMQADKLMLAIAGQPIVAHTWGRFDKLQCIDEIVIVVREGTQHAFKAISEQNKFEKPFRLVPGGMERQDSVWNGLCALSAQTRIVVIQDAARPCITGALVNATVQAAQQTGAAVAAQRVTDTIKESNDGRYIARTVDRTRLWTVQTPQTFRLEVIKRALAEARRQGVILTDDTAACELIGQPVQLVEAADPNPKITTPADLPFIENLLKQQSGLHG